MPLPYLLDEHLRGYLWKAVQRHNQQTAWTPLDVVRVGYIADLPFGTPDPDILVWSEHQQRILVSADRRTMQGFFANHLAAGHHSPGLFMLRPDAALAAVLDFMILAAYASEPDEWRDRIEYIG